MKMDSPLKNRISLTHLMKQTAVSLMVLGLTSPLALAWATKPATESIKTESQTAASAQEKVVSVPNETTKHLTDISKGFITIAEAALPAVVNVATTQVIEAKDRSFDLPRNFPGLPEDLFRDFFDFDRPRRVQSLGSGFIIRSDKQQAFIVTNYHVIADAKKISIFLNDKTELEATVHAFDERTDIAILKVKTESLPPEKRQLPTLQWGDSEKAKVGEWVLAIGNPFGLGSTVTNGIISSKGRDLVTPSRNSYVDAFIQHSAQINMGNSGGCLLDTSGKVIGINTAIFSPSGGNVGIGFAIPSDIAQKTVEQLMEHGRTKRGWLGVRIQNLTDDMAESLGLKTQGAIIGSITPDGPAQKAGLQSGDVVLEFDGKLINESNRLSRLVGETPIGKECKIKVWRKGKELTLDVKIGEFEDALQKGKIDGESKNVEDQAIEVLGIKVTTIPEEMKQRYAQTGPTKGVFVMKVDSNSPGVDVGLMRGDLIVEANQKELIQPKDFKDCIEEAKKSKRKNILLLVIRNNEPRYVSLKIDEENESKTKDGKENESLKNPEGKSEANPGAGITPFGKSPPLSEHKKEIVPEHPANAPQPAPAA